MFEKVGLRDVFFKIKQWWKLFIVILVVMTFLAAAFVTVKRKNQNSETVQNDIYYSSTTYLVTVNPNSDLYGLSNETGDLHYASRRVALTYQQLLQGNVAKEFAAKKLLEEYTLDDLKSELSLSKSSKDYLEQLGLFFTAEVLPDTSSLNIFVESYDKDFSRKVLTAYQAFLEENLIGNLGEDVMINNIGESNQIISGSETLPKSSSLRPLGYKKTLLLSSLFSVFFYIGIAVLLAFIHPTINRDSDFEEYEVLVLGKVNV